MMTRAWSRSFVLAAALAIASALHASPAFAIDAPLAAPFAFADRASILDAILRQPRGPDAVDREHPIRRRSQATLAKTAVWNVDGARCLVALVWFDRPYATIVWRPTSFGPMDAGSLWSSVPSSEVASPVRRRTGFSISLRIASIAGMRCSEFEIASAWKDGAGTTSRSSLSKRVRSQKSERFR